MDSRIDVFGILGLGLGQAHVIRNAGGVVSDDVIRSLMSSQRLLGTEAIILIHHPDCGSLSFRDDTLKAEIEADTGLRPPRSPSSPSPISKQTSVSRCDGFRQVPSSDTKSMSGDSSMTSIQGVWLRLAEHPCP